MKYVAIYKCPLCGSTIRGSNLLEISKEKAIEMTAKIIKYQFLQTNSYFDIPPLYTICHCSNDNVGMAQFAGLIEVSTREYGPLA